MVPQEWIDRVVKVVEATDLALGSPKWANGSKVLPFLAKSEVDGFVGVSVGACGVVIQFLLPDGVSEEEAIEALKGRIECLTFRGARA